MADEITDLGSDGRLGDGCGEFLGSLAGSAVESAAGEEAEQALIPDGSGGAGCAGWRRSETRSAIVGDPFLEIKCGDDEKCQQSEAKSVGAWRSGGSIFGETGGSEELIV